MYPQEIKLQAYKGLIRPGLNLQVQLGIPINNIYKINLNGSKNSQLDLLPETIHVNLGQWHQY